MVYDILEVFKKEYEKNGDKLILGSYTLKDGLYVKINKDGICEYFEVKTVKKEKIFTDIDGNLNSQMLDWFKQRDYYSSYLNSNKSLFDKKIHNINYLSYYFKIENATYVKEKIDNHFEILRDFEKFKNKKDREILNKYKDLLEDENRKKDINEKSKLLKEQFDEINQIAKDKGVKNYIKIFFDKDIETYKKESEIYLSLKIFNDNKYNQKIQDEIYGLSNSNMGLNAKKPFLEYKNRKVHVPFMIKNEDALILKKFFDWLKIQPYNKDRYLDEEYFFMQKKMENDEALIKEFDYIPLKSDKLKKAFKSIYVKNYLNTKKDGKLIEDYEIKELWQLEEKVDELFYNAQLRFNYFKDDKEIKESNFLSKQLQTILYITKYSMINYFKKYDDSSFYTNIKKYGVDFIVNHLLFDRTARAKQAMNLKLALENHKGEKIMDIKKMQDEIKENLNKNDYLSLKEDEFFYLCGQVVRYLLNQSEAHEKKADMLEPYFRANNSQKLKKNIEQTFFKYKHKIFLNHSRFNNAMSLIMAFEENIKLSNNMDSLLIGALSDNIFYADKKEEE